MIEVNFDLSGLDLLVEVLETGRFVENGPFHEGHSLENASYQRLFAPRRIKVLRYVVPLFLEVGIGDRDKGGMVQVAKEGLWPFNGRLVFFHAA